MSSIKQNGLLEPIGVWIENGEYILAYGHRRLEACKKLGWNTIDVVMLAKGLTEKDFLFLNTIENIQRKDIAPVELGNVCYRLKNDYSMSIGEIAARLSITPTTVEKHITFYKNVPENKKSQVGHGNGSTPKKGKIPITTTNRITVAHISKSMRNDLFDLSRIEEYSLKDVELLIKFMEAGATIGQAVKNLKKYERKHIDCVVNKEKLKEIDIKEPFNRYIVGIVNKRHPGLMFIR
jgi:ParB/RepB/Spo0J family partition protein